MKIVSLAAMVLSLNLLMLVWGGWQAVVTFWLLASLSLFYLGYISR